MPNDITKSNGYTIQHCSLLTAQVQNTLENLYDVLPPAIWQTHYGVASAPYQALFKDSYYETVVDDVLSKILIGEPIHWGAEILVPSLVCALKAETVIVHRAGQDIDIYDICMQNPSWAVLYYPEPSDIFICPIFFLLPTLPSAGNCPTVNEATDKFEGNITAFLQSQVYVLLHEIAHFYIGVTVEDSVDEVVDWNYAFSLSPRNATCNALNYVLFVASELTFVTMVYNRWALIVLLKVSTRNVKNSRKQINRTILEVED